MPDYVSNNQNTVENKINQLSNNESNDNNFTTNINQNNTNERGKVNGQNITNQASPNSTSDSYQQLKVPDASSMGISEDKIDNLSPDAGLASSTTNQDNQGNLFNGIKPFDLRMARVVVKSNNSLSTGQEQMPFWSKYKSYSYNGLLISEEALSKSNTQTNGSSSSNITNTNLKNLQEQFARDTVNQGVPSIMNNYAITKLYGSEGGLYLLNQRKQRKYYEIDLNSDEIMNYSQAPTTSTIISWGNADPYGRQPYNFTDFVFCKYWNKIPNNRLITLRRFAAPILDNMRFPGMDGTSSLSSQNGSSQNDNKNGDVNKKQTADVSNSTGKINFPPLATAVTYFGGETGNSLSNILKFTTGVLWEDLKAEIWDVTNSGSTPENGSINDISPYNAVSSLSKALNIVTGEFNADAEFLKGAIPPDPYKDGPYANRILGPVNRIDSVKKRKPGLEFKMDGLKLVFEYCARPIGGMNTKAVLLDILSNFLVIGSASAVFYGGQHRFMINPKMYPFIGGDKGMRAWYTGDPQGFMNATMNKFSDDFNALKGAGGLFDVIKGFASKLFSGDIMGAIKDVANSQVGKNAGTAAMAHLTKSSAPMLSGMRSLLIGEPVGEWHVTIGNPLNPIAMIGNLICTNIEVEFGEELGPDDFPLEIKITVNLDHGMPRDRDAIQSIFNRGMGRIYELPDGFLGSADKETKVDNVTGQSMANSGATGWGAILTSAGSGRPGHGYSAVKVEKNQLGEVASVWERVQFQAISFDQYKNFTIPTVTTRSLVRTQDWIGKLIK